MSKLLLLITFIFPTMLSCKSSQSGEKIKKTYEQTSSRLERTAESDLFLPPNMQNTSKTYQPQIDLDAKNSLSHAAQEVSVVARSIEELNEGRYQNVIDRLTLYIANEQKNKSRITEQEIGLKPLRDIYLILALAYTKAGDDVHAQPIFDKLIFYADNWEPIYLSLCELYLKNNAFSLAKSVALKGIGKLVHPSAQIYIYYARSEMGLNNMNSAKKTLEQVKIFFPKNSEVLGWLGMIDLKSNNIIDACEKFKESYNLNKENSSLVYNHAACLIRAQDYKEAQSVLRVGGFNSNFDPGFFYLNGLAENKQGRPLEAQKYWENYIKLADVNDPRQPYVKAFLSAIRQPH